jgi:flagellar M-ring protein FliF
VWENAKRWWGALKTAAKAGLAAGALAVVVLFALSLAWVMRDDYQVLFSDLDPQDGAAIVAELERMKVPYRLTDNGNTILVDHESVHKTRLKLMGKGVNLKGTVGFELFNNSDFGMTEFAQKINYQRAMQGELARTIMSLNEVKHARVHLVVPESGLLRRGTAKPKASVILTLRESGRLRAEQILGIQRLVAAAVADMEPAAVTVLDQQGVALNRAGDAENASGAVSARLELKKDAETYFTKKILEVLDKAFGPGQAIVSVDVTINQDQVKVTREDVIPFARKDGEVAGAVTRKRQQFQGPGARDVESPSSSDGVRRDYRPAAQTSTIEIEYENGKKVEQIVTAPGSILHLSVGVVLPGQVDAARIQRVSDLIAMTVGLNAQRGDAIVVHSLDQLMTGQAAADTTSGPKASSFGDAAEHSAKQPGETVAGSGVPPFVLLGLLGAALLVVVGTILATFRKRAAPAAMTAEQRQETVDQIKTWLDRGRAPAQGRG